MDRSLASLARPTTGNWSLNFRQPKQKERPQETGAFFLEEYRINKVQDDQQNHDTIHHQVYANVFLVLLVEFPKPLKHFSKIGKSKRTYKVIVD